MGSYVWLNPERCQTLWHVLRTATDYQQIISQASRWLRSQTAVLGSNVRPNYSTKVSYASGTPARISSNQHAVEVSSAYSLNTMKGCSHLHHFLRAPGKSSSLDYLVDYLTEIHSLLFCIARLNLHLFAGSFRLWSVFRSWQSLKYHCFSVFSSFSLSKGG